MYQPCGYLARVHIPAHIRAVQPFLAMELMERAQEMERGGIHVVHLEIGEPDFEPPPAALQACAEALGSGQTNYTDSRGLPELRDAIAADKTRRTGSSVDPARVIVTSGTSPAMLMVFGLLLAPGDEVVIPSPHYACYPNFVRFCGGTPVAVPCDPAAGYAVDVDAVRSALTPRTRAIVVGTPANPTGAIQSRETLEALASLGVPLVCDEIYDGLVYGDARVTSALEITDQAFVLDGFSKRYAMTGFRLGYVIAPEAALRTLQSLQQNLFISASEFVQRAGIAALEQGGATIEAARASLAPRRRLLIDGLRQLGFEIPVEPEGAFYVFVDARAFSGDSLALANELLDRAHVAVTPGIDFGAAGEGWLRFCYAAPEADLREALARLSRWAAAARPSA
ncbi:MAG: pyridoxal phosphate-dependent aminotransferase [Deltaproteobacteria bacterium]|nr:pyridoxal phosphate-dependent aminotransferase [Deltaproteobacteria bacterium]MBW2395183.1 pyridoxal phosphate-dependent aminotransferase [Deltaproteobacteria bacterium]